MSAQILLAGFSLCLAAGCTSLGPAERESLLQASSQYNRGDLAGATARLDHLIRDFDKAQEIGEAYYIRGLCRATAGQVSAAGQDFETALSKSKRKDLTARCKASLGAIAYRNLDWPKAAELYGAALDDLPDEPPTDQILYSAGICMQRVGKWPEASRQFGRILLKFRNSPIAGNARAKASWGHPYYSIQLGAFSSATNAAKAVKEFRGKGLAAVQENQSRNGSAIWLIMSGRYSTYGEASAALPRARQVQSDAIIIP